MEEDVHGHDGPRVEQGVDTDVLHLVVLAPQLTGAHLKGGTKQGGAEPGDTKGELRKGTRFSPPHRGLRGSDCR